MPRCWWSSVLSFECSVWRASWPRTASTSISRRCSCFRLVIGFGGSFISLALSKTLAKHGMGVHIIDQPRNNTERWLVETVRRQAKDAGIGMPEVGVFDSPQPNAFATGANRNNALVAVSSGLLQNMSSEEVDAVLGHEVSHVSNGDMVTMALLQGVVNTFVIFLSRVVGFVVDRVVFRTERGIGPGYFITSIIAQIFFSILASMIVMWFSRRREFRADAGGAEPVGSQQYGQRAEAASSGARAKGPSRRICRLWDLRRDELRVEEALLEPPTLGGAHRGSAIAALAAHGIMRSQDEAGRLGNAYPRTRCALLGRY